MVLLDVRIWECPFRFTVGGSLEGAAGGLFRPVMRFRDDFGRKARRRWKRKMLKVAKETFGLDSRQKNYFTSNDPHHDTSI